MLFQDYNLHLCAFLNILEKMGFKWEDEWEDKVYEMFDEKLGPQIEDYEDIKHLYGLSKPKNPV